MHEACTFQLANLQLLAVLHVKWSDAELQVRSSMLSTEAELIAFELIQTVWEEAVAAVCAGSSERS
jgi:hypothetical protein